MFDDEMIASITQRMLAIEVKAFDETTTEAQVRQAVIAWLQAVAETLTEEPEWYIYGPSMEGQLRPRTYEQALDEARRGSPC